MRTARSLILMAAITGVAACGASSDGSVTPRDDDVVTTDVVTTDVVTTDVVTTDVVTTDVVTTDVVTTDSMVVVDTPPDVSATSSAFCIEYAALSGERPESYVGSAEHIADLDTLASAAPDPVRADVVVYRDYLASGAIDSESDPDSNLVENWPTDIQASIAGVTGFADDACEGTGTDSEAGADPAGDATVAIRLEEIEGVFIEGFEIGIRIENGAGDVLASTLWSDAVISAGGSDIDDYYDTVYEAAVPSGTIVVRATVNIGPGGPPETPDLDGDLRCRLDLDVEKGSTSEVEVIFDTFESPDDCLRRV